MGRYASPSSGAGSPFPARAPLTGGFHRIRHYGLFANGSRANNIAQARKLLNVPASQIQSTDTNAPKADDPPALAQPCPCCGGRMLIIERFERGSTPRYRPSAPTPAITLAIHFSGGLIV